MLWSRSKYYAKLWFLLQTFCGVFVVLLLLLLFANFSHLQNLTLWCSVHTGMVHSPVKHKTKSVHWFLLTFQWSFTQGSSPEPKKSSWRGIHTYSGTCCCDTCHLGVLPAIISQSSHWDNFYMLGRSCEQMAEAGRRKSGFAPCSPVLPDGLLRVIILCEVLSDKGSGFKYCNELSAGVPQVFWVMTPTEQTSPQLWLKYYSYFKKTWAGCYQ